MPTTQNVYNSGHFSKRTDLSHPLVLDLGDLGIGVAHHSDQEVQQQDHNDCDEDEEVYFADYFVIRFLHPLPDEANITKRHQEDS